MARSRLFDVSGNECRHSCSPANVALRPAIATSKAVRDAADARISSVRRWPPRQPSPATLLMSETGVTNSFGTHASSVQSGLSTPEACVPDETISSTYRHAVPLDRANVDTDQIIPKQFLKRVERTGFGQFLFYDWRFQPDGQPMPGFRLMNVDTVAAPS